MFYRHLRVLYVASLSILISPASNAAPSHQDVLKKLHAINQSEIHFGKLAQQKGQSPEIKKYGKTMEEDHAGLDAEVEEFAKSEGLDLDVDSPVIAKEKAREGVISDRLRLTTPRNFDSIFISEMERTHLELISELSREKESLKGKATANLIENMLPKLREHELLAARLEDEYQM